MSFRYRFILAFVTVEILFLSLIVFVNFSSLQRSSQALIMEKVESSSRLFSDLIAIPVSVYDLATIDDAIKTILDMKNVVGVRVTDQSGQLLADKVLKTRLTSQELHGYIDTGRDGEQIDTETSSFILKKVPIVVEDTSIGEVSIFFDITESLETINFNRDITLLIVLIEIMISVLVAYFIGWRISRSLERLSGIAKQLADNESVSIPYYPNQQNEIARLFNTMHLMQAKIDERTANLEIANEDLKQMIYAIDQSALVSKTDTEGTITYVNSAFCAVNDYTPEELIGHTHKMVRDPEMPSSFYEKLWEIIQSKKVFRGTISNLDRHGQRYYVDTTIVPILDMNGEIKEYLASAYEVTELIEARNKAIESERFKGEFISNMSHEIRTPLNAIIGFISILQRQITDEKSTHYLKVINDSSKLLLEIINNILDISKIQSDKLNIEIHPCDFRESIGAVSELFSQSAQQKGVELDVYIDKEIPACLMGDKTRVQQICSNLLSNAIKFTDAGGIVMLKALYDTGKSELVISVKDSGIGIPVEVQESIFKPFEQADGSTTRKYGGTGLGLAIGLELCRLMKGDIILESEPGMGSMFIVSIPMQVCDADKEKQAGRLPGGEYKERHDIPSFSGKALVVEDKQTNQLLIKVMLEEFGVDCVIADDGVEGVQRFKEDTFDLVFMDENMPNKNGIEAFNDIRRYEAESGLEPTPVIACSANALSEDRKKFIQVGMDGFLAKPIEENNLEAILVQHLSQKKNITR